MMLFSIPKNYIQEKKILKMSYMKYLLVVIQHGMKNSNVDLVMELTSFLRYVTHQDQILILSNSTDDTIEGLRLKLQIKDVEFTEYEFDNIREILLAQNGLNVEYIEEYNPELEEKLMFLNKGSENITFEEEVFSFASLLKKTIFEIQDYTVYQFKKHFERTLMVYNYELYKPLEVSGQIKLKEGNSIQDYLSHVENKRRYSTILLAKDKYVEQNSEVFN
jgi:hypothetical protein